MYDQGLGLQEDDTEAVKWYRVAAEGGYVAAQIGLAAMYDEGSGTALDKAEAVRWYRRAAEQDNVDAQYNLGLAYARGEFTSVEIDEPQPCGFQNWAAQDLIV